MKNIFILLFLNISIIGCVPLKSIKISETQYTDIIETINKGLSLSKDKIDTSNYKLKSGSIKIYMANNLTSEAGVAFWIIEGGSKSANEKASSITYNFSEISEPMSGDINVYKFKPKDLSDLINKSIDNYEHAGDILTLTKDGFNISIKFSVTNSGNNKLNLDFGIGANVKGSFGKTASHEINLSFVPKK